MKYVLFRISYAIQLRFGLLKRKYPTNPKLEKFISLQEWREQAAPFFFTHKDALVVPKHQSPILKEAFDRLNNGEFPYFNATYYPLSLKGDWLVNPSNGYEYDVNKHWTEVADFSSETGDIKYVWEKSRFSFLYTIIRYDYHFGVDCASLVFEIIDEWIAINPINQGPNYKCSQEISLRTLNWLFALYYYKHSEALTEERFARILHVIYWQMKHVYQNINFSRIAVRNNHAITETLMLFLGGIYFPFFPEGQIWKHKGKKWFEEEVLYQIYADGTYLQFSHNYQRVVVQLLTWAFHLAQKNEIAFSTPIYDRVKLMVDYLYVVCDTKHGALPNYGANDGALFFKLNDAHYRDYRPQINALNAYFYGCSLYENEGLEDLYWYGTVLKEKQYEIPSSKQANQFDEGGIYTLNDTDQSLTFIKCASYKDRPSHADNLHLDIWVEGKNLLRDAGTFQYNTSKDLMAYFNGTSAHNTITIDNYDQMQKGPRFIWLNWSGRVYAQWTEKDDHYLFEGAIEAFGHLKKGITHQRTIKKYKGQLKWEIEDEVSDQIGLPIKQWWNPDPLFFELYEMTAIDKEGKGINPKLVTGHYSSFYGKMQDTEAVVFETITSKINTSITKK